MAVHDALFRTAELRPDATALVSGGESLTYGELAAQVRAVAGRLLAGGLSVGDRVAITAPNSPDAAVAVLAVLAAGGCIVVVDPAAPAHRVVRIVDHSGARCVLASAGRAAEVTSVLAGGGLTTPVTVIDRSPAGDGPVLPTVDPGDLAALIYTSGSTGEPKGVTHTHRSVGAVVAAVAEYLDHRPDDVVLSVLQLAFGYGLLQLLVTLHSGGELRLETGIGFPMDLATKLADGVTGFAGVPTVFASLLQLRNIDELDLSSMRYLTNAAAALPASFVPRLRATFPRASIFLMHGQTECFRTSYLPPDQLDVRPESIGRGMPGVELWLEDETGRRLPNGSEGQLHVRGDGIMTGYWNDPETSAKVLRADGDGRVLRTGDLFRTDADGWFTFVARMDDIIKSRGEKVSPIEVEGVLYSFPGVVEARVLGVADEILGQAIRAELVLAPGIDLDERALRRHLRSQLEPHKLPQQIVAVDSLPKTSGGKIIRR